MQDRYLGARSYIPNEALGMLSTGIHSSIAHRDFLDEDGKSS